MLGLGTAAMTCRALLECPNKRFIDTTYDQIRHNACSLGWMLSMIASMIATCNQTAHGGAKAVATCHNARHGIMNPAAHQGCTSGGIFWGICHAWVW